MYLTTPNDDHDQHSLGKSATMKTGPNDAGRIVWAISKFFFKFFCVFCKLTIIFRYIYHVPNDDERRRPPTLTPLPRMMRNKRKCPRDVVVDISWAIGNFFFHLF